MYSSFQQYFCTAFKKATQTSNHVAWSLVPLGVGMWASHLLFHFFTSYQSIMPVTQRALHDLGYAAAPTQIWSMGSSPEWLLQGELFFTWSKLPRIVCHLLATNNHIATTSNLGHYNCFAVCCRRLDIASTNADEGNDRMIKSLLVCTLLLCTCAFADNGHLLGTSKTEQYNVAVFAEPWPARVGRLSTAVHRYRQHRQHC